MKKTQLDDGITLVPGAGWGNGDHETTQLCLQAIKFMAPRGQLPWRMLDFGSGSGILALTAAKLGAMVEGIEIDEAGIANAQENARINGVAKQIRFARTLDDTADGFELVVANILRPILLEFSEPLTARLGPRGILILSGLVSTDIPEVSTRYSSFLDGRHPVVYKRGEWRALIWQMT